MMAAEAAQEATKKGVDFAGEVAKLVLMGRDAPTRFRGELGARKQVAWADPLPLEEVKAVGKALGCSINDVLLSMAAGALRDYLADKGDEVPPTCRSARSSRSTCARPPRRSSSATTSASSSSSCRSAWPIPWSASTRCAAACGG
jgi:hypothetical protein